MGVELASAFVSIIPTTKGLQSNLEKELSPLSGAAAKAGDSSGKALGSSFTGASGGLKSSVDQAGGHLDNFKTKATGALGSVGISTGVLAAAGGAAIVGFGVHAVSAFTETAKAALDLGTSTGLSTEEASKWIAVGDDFEVGADALATGLGKVAKTLDDTKWAKYGIETRDAAGNARSANDILLDSFDTLSKITNETERAKAGQELFGKGYQSLTPILGHTREEYEKMLGTVEKGQVITAEEAARAEKMRLAQDNLGDALADVSLAFGGLLAGLSPVIDLLAKGVNVISDVVGVVTGLVFGTDNATASFNKFFTELDKQTSVKQIGEELEAMERSASQSGAFVNRLFEGATGKTKWEYLAETIKKMGEESPAAVGGVVTSLNDLKAAADAGDPAAQKLIDDYKLTDEHLKQLSDYALPKTLDGVEKLNASMVNSQNSAEGYSYAVRSVADSEAAAKADAERLTAHLGFLEAQWDSLTGKINADKAWLNLQTGFDDIKVKSMEAWDAAIKGADDAEAKSRDYQEALADQKLGVIDYGKEVLKLPIEQVTKIQALVDQGKFDEAEAMLERLKRNRAALFQVDVQLNTAKFKVIALAGGGYASGPAVINDAGPELVNLPNGSWVATAAASQALMASSLSGGNATSTPRLNIEHLEVHNDTDADGFFRYANFAMAAV